MNGSSSRKQLKTRWVLPATRKEDELSHSYRASPKSIRPLYTGGPVLLTKDGKWLITTMDEEVLVTEVESGLAIGKIKGDGSAITSLALSYHTSPPTLITSHLSTMMRWYPLPPDSSDGKSMNMTYTRQNPKSHSAPVLVSAISPDNALLATGSSDGIVKLWDLAGGYVTHLFRGHGGPVSALKFHYFDGRMELWTGSTDGKVRIFDLKAGASGSGSAAGTASSASGSKAIAVLEGHVSVVRGIDFTEDGKYAITGGRDRVVLVWDLSEGSGRSQSSGKGKKKEGGPRVIQTIIAGELVESVGVLPSGEEILGAPGSSIRCWTGGEKGTVRIWDILKGTEVGSMKGVEGVDEAEVDEDDPRGILNVLCDPSTSSLVSVHADQNIIYHSLASGLPTRQIVGFNDEIVDSTFLSPLGSQGDGHSHLALATNSNLIRIYSMDHLDARLLSGHKDMVLCLDRSSDYKWLVSGSKDHTARIWAPSEDGTYRCVAICEGHAESIGAVAFSRSSSPPKFLVTASQDRTIKLWDLSDVSSVEDNGEPSRPRSLATLRAHEKDINSLDIAPNDRFLASGSQDKTVKIFAIDFTQSNSGASGGLKLLGTCSGHRRGVWTVKFSRTDKIVASGAADRTVRLWSLDNFTCLKGHTNSVLRVDFLSSGMQLITSGGDGLVKLWNIRDEECIKTLDNHEDKIWALAMSSDERTIVSAGADSVATIWQDSSEIEQAEKNEAIVAQVQSEQDFTNYLAIKDYKRAIQLALGMSQPGRLLHLFRTISASSSLSHNAITNGVSTATSGSPEIDRIVSNLSPLDLVRLLKFIRDWNANAKTSPVAQTVLHSILRLKTPDEIVGAFEKSQKLASRVPPPEGEDDEMPVEADEQPKKKKEVTIGLRELLDGLIPYSERHFGRMDKLVQESYMLDYIVGEMDGGLFGGELMDVDGQEHGEGYEKVNGLNGD